MGIMNKVKTVIKHPHILLEWLVRQPGIRNIVSDKIAISVLYRCRFHRKMDWKNPKSINEKFLWLTVFDRNPLYSILVDKYEAKQWMSKKLEQGRYSLEHIIPTINIYNSFDSIDFEKLPDSFVLKTTHDSGTVKVINSKDDITKNSKESIKKQFNKSLKRNYYWFSREWQYKAVIPRIIAEKKLIGKNDDLADYKIFCFDGKAKYWNYISNRKIDEYVDYVSMDGERIPCSQGDYKTSTGDIRFPECWNEMVEIAEYMSSGFTFLRVDFFVDENGKFYLGELTLTPSSGLLPFHPDEWDYKFGEMMKLPNISD